MASALEIIKSRGPISAAELAKLMNVEEKQARDAIDGLRAKGEPIWLDVERGFWWANDRKPSGVAHVKWKRSHQSHA